MFDKPVTEMNFVFYQQYLIYILTYIILAQIKLKRSPTFFSNFFKNSKKRRYFSNTSSVMTFTFKDLFPQRDFIKFVKQTDHKEAKSEKIKMQQFVVQFNNFGRCVSKCNVVLEEIFYPFQVVSVLWIENPPKVVGIIFLANEIFCLYKFHEILLRTI